MFYSILNPNLLYRFYEIFNTFYPYYSIVKIKELNENEFTEFFNHLKDSGPVIIKMIQWLVSKEIFLLKYNFNLNQINQLKRLQDSCNPTNINRIIEYINENSINLNLDNIINVPLGVGSIAEVYKIDDKVIKLIKPDIEYKLKLDISIFDKIIKYNYFFDNNIIEIINFTNINDIYNDLKNQSNLEIEANNLLIFNDMFKDNEYVRIPSLYQKNEKYLIESFEKGYKINEFSKKYFIPIKKIKLRKGLIYYQMINKGFVHGDLHNGNILLNLENNKIIFTLLDFGLAIKINNDDIIKFKQISKIIYKCAIKSNTNLLMEYVQLLIDQKINCLLRNKIKKNIKIMYNKLKKKEKNLTNNTNKKETETFTKYMNFIDLIILFCKNENLKLNNNLINLSIYLFLFILDDKHLSIINLINYFENNNLNYLIN